MKNVFRTIACAVVLLLLTIGSGLTPESRASTSSPSAHAIQKCAAVAPVTFSTNFSTQAIRSVSDMAIFGIAPPKLQQNTTQTDTTAAKASAKRSRFDFKTSNVNPDRTPDTGINRSPFAYDKGFVVPGVIAHDVVLRL